jgi:hypothetical protein
MNTQWEVHTISFMADNDEEYDRQLNSWLADGWEPFAGERGQDHWYTVRLRRVKAKENDDG